MKSKHPTARRQHGVSLLESALVVLTIGVVLGVSMVAQTQSASRSTASEAAFMDSAVSALFKYALRNNRLPCPDNLTGTATGYEQVTGSTCSLKVGRVPYFTIGVPLSGPIGTGVDQQFTYGVYTGGGSAGTDLTQNAERSLPTPHVQPNASYKNLDDFKQGVINAWGTTATTGEIYATGNDGDSGTSTGCPTVANMAFIVAFKGSRNAAVTGAPATCFMGPAKPFSPTYDNLVRAVSFSELLGVLSR